jgi:hypothetical protein
VRWRKPKLPAESMPALERDERVLAWAAGSDAEVVVATSRGLWLGRTRLRWHEINKVTWADRVMRVTASTSVPAADGGDYAVVTDVPPVAVKLPEPRDLPKRVQQRVTASVPYSSRYPLPGGGSALVVGRRVSGQDGLSWFVRYDGRTDPTDPEIVKTTSEIVAAAKASISVVG